MTLSTTARKVLFVVLIVSTLFLAAAILADWFPLLRGPAPETKEWYWPYLLRPVQRWWPSAAAAMLMWAAGAWWLRRSNHRRSDTVLALVALALASILLQLGLIYADRQHVAAELIDRTLSHLSSGFFLTAASIEDMDAVLSNYPVEMRVFVSEHARTHPPGLVTANWLTIQAMARMGGLTEQLARVVQPLRCTDLWLLNRPAGVSAALGIWSLLPLLFAASTVLPAYLAARELMPSSAVRLATVLSASLPALLLFAPKSVQIYAPLSLVMFWLFHTGLLRQSVWRLMIAGFIGSILTFLNLGNATLFLLLALYALFMLGALLRGDVRFIESISGLIGPTIAFAVGAVSVWMLYWILSGVAPWEIVRVGLGEHYELVTNLRNYRWWVVWNLVDLLIYSGWPVSLGFLGSLIIAFQVWRRRRLTAVHVLAVVLAIVVVVLDLSGSSRGEVGRLWLFLMPMMALVAGHFWTRALPGTGRAMTIIALQLLMVLALGWAWQSVRAAIVVAEQPAQSQVTPAIDLDAELLTEPTVLAGYTLDSTVAQSGSSLTLTLVWRSDGPASRPFTVFNHLVDANGQLQSQQDGWPVGGQWPPTCWRAGDIVVDEHTIPIPAELSPGSYRLLTGLYDNESGQRLQFEDGSDSFELGTIEVVPK